MATSAGLEKANGATLERPTSKEEDQRIDSLGKEPVVKVVRGIGVLWVGDVHLSLRDGVLGEVTKAEILAGGGDGRITEVATDSRGAGEDKS